MHIVVLIFGICLIFFLSGCVGVFGIVKLTSFIGLDRDYKDDTIMEFTIHLRLIIESINNSKRYTIISKIILIGWAIFLYVTAIPIYLAFNSGLIIKYGFKCIGNKIKPLFVNY